MINGNRRGGVTLFACRKALPVVEDKEQIETRGIYCDFRWNVVSFASFSGILLPDAYEQLSIGCGHF